MARECPVGTIHIWGDARGEGTEMIKAHDPVQPYSSGWVPLRTTPRFDQVGRECDAYGRDILSHKLPIDGEKFLDHEIDEFGEKEGGDFFRSGEFKKFEGWHDSGRYAFRNQFSKLYMDNIMRLDEEVARAVYDANAALGLDPKEDHLSAEEKKEVRAEIRARFKSNPDTIDEEKVLRLLEIIKKTKEQIEIGLDFKDPLQKKAYEDFRIIVDALPETYELISEKRKLRLKAVDLMEDMFPDNWGVRESCKDYAQKKFDEYVRKYADRISKDSLEEQLKMFGVTIDMEPDEFYSKIYAKAVNTNYDYLEKYVGKEIRFAGHDVRYKVIKENGQLYYVDQNGYKYLLIAALKNNEYHLSPEYDEFGGGFKDLVYLRFMKRYGKSIEGEWTLEQLPAIHNLENLANELPDGQFKTNEELYLITNKSYAGGDHGGYAWYNRGERRINLSAQCIARATVWGVLQNPSEFKSVLLHEIGHSIDAKINGTATYDYKKFVVDCGWTYQSKELRAGMSATGNQKDILRTGSNASTTLITDYAHKSPSEAFAEYYSFYNLNKKHFDKYFETGDTQYLQTDSKIIAKSVSSEQKIKQMLGTRIIKPGDDHEYELKHERPKRVNVPEGQPQPPPPPVPTIGAQQVLKTYNEVTQALSDRGQDHQITLTNPWSMKLSIEEQAKFNPKRVKERKGFSINSMPPLVVVKNGATRVVIDGGVRMEVARMNKQLAPCIEISKEEYYNCRDRGMDDRQISDCVYTKHADDWVPKQIAPAVRVSGLIYRDELVPLDVILDNHDGIKTMKDLCESKTLQKAIEELFGDIDDGFNKAIQRGKLYPKKVQVKGKDGKTHTAIRWVKIQEEEKPVTPEKKEKKTFISDPKKSVILSQLKGMLQLNLSDQQKEYMEWKLKHAKLISTFTHTDEIRQQYPAIDRFLKHFKPVVKECYRNASRMAVDVPGIEYVEGSISLRDLPIEIEHAWNKVGDQYFDIMSDNCWDERSMPTSEYVSFVELNDEALDECMLEDGMYGECVKKTFLKELKAKQSTFSYEPNSALKSKAHQLIETKFADELKWNLDAKEKEYKAKFHNVLSGDNAKELSEDYMKDPMGLSEAVHEPASGFVKYLYNKELSVPVTKDQDNVVVFTAGGSGAGKTTGITQFGVLGDLTKKANIVYDTTMSSFRSADNKIQQAIKHDRDVVILYVYRGLEDAFTNGVVPRMKATGRVIPYYAHVMNHIDSLATIKKLTDKYKDSDRVSIQLVDNSNGFGNARIMTPEELNNIKFVEPEHYEKELLAEINKQKQNGQITERQYKGLLGSRSVT
jgi:hypothetical protein